MMRLSLGIGIGAVFFCLSVAFYGTNSPGMAREMTRSIPVKPIIASEQLPNVKIKTIDPLTSEILETWTQKAAPKRLPRPVTGQFRDEYRTEMWSTTAPALVEAGSGSIVGDVRVWDVTRPVFDESAMLIDDGISWQIGEETIRMASRTWLVADATQQFEAAVVDWEQRTANLQRARHRHGIVADDQATDPKYQGIDDNGTVKGVVDGAKVSDLMAAVQVLEARLRALEGR